MRTKGLIALFVLAVLTVSSFAQKNGKRFGFEVSSRVSMGTNKLGESTLIPGFGFEGIFQYRFMPHLMTNKLLKHSSLTAFFTC